MCVSCSPIASSRFGPRSVEAAQSAMTERQPKATRFLKVGSASIELTESAPRSR